MGEVSGAYENIPMGVFAWSTISKIKISYISLEDMFL